MNSAAKTRFCLTAVVCLLAPLFSSAQATPPANGPFFISLEVPNSTGTYPMGVNDSLSVAGYYKDASQQIHGFVRLVMGQVTSFDVAGSIMTQPVGINDMGEIAGSYEAASGIQRGFLRLANGTITTFNPSDAQGSTVPTAINASGEIAGVYSTSALTPPSLGFLRYANGSIATFGIAGSTFVNPQSINADGEVTGEYLYDGNTQIGGFVRHANAQITTFHYEQGIVPSGINKNGMVTGWYATTGFHGFLRSAEGVLTSFDPPGTLLTQYISINRAGQVTGSYNVKTSIKPSVKPGGSTPSILSHGFLRAHDGNMESFDPPGSFQTTPTSINTLGVVTGWYFGSMGQAVGFMRVPQMDCDLVDPQ
jgi:hypothetical protein